MGITGAAPDGWGLNMRSNIMQFTIRMIVAFGIAIVGVIAVSDVVAYSSSAERAWVIKQETLTVERLCNTCHVTRNDVTGWSSLIAIVGRTLLKRLG
jgi:hypothetical protein